MLHLLDLALVGATAVVVALVVRAYRAAEGTRWERMRASWVIGWSYFVIAATGIIDALASLVGVIDPSLAAQFQSVSPQAAAAVLVLSMVVTIAARLRSLWS